MMRCLTGAHYEWRVGGEDENGLRVIGLTRAQQSRRELRLVWRVGKVERFEADSTATLVDYALLANLIAF